MRVAPVLWTWRKQDNLENVYFYSCVQLGISLTENVPGALDLSFGILYANVWEKILWKELLKKLYLFYEKQLKTFKKKKTKNIFIKSQEYLCIH